MEKCAQGAIHFTGQNAMGDVLLKISATFQFNLLHTLRYEGLEKYACLLDANDNTSMRYLEQNRPMPYEYFRRLRYENVYCLEFFHHMPDAPHLDVTPPAKLVDIPPGYYVLVAYIAGQPPISPSDMLRYQFRVTANVGIRGK